MDKRIPEYTDTRIYRNNDTQIQGYTDTKINRYKDIQIQGYTDTRIYRYKDIQIQGYTDWCKEIARFDFISTCCRENGFWEGKYNVNSTHLRL